MLKRSLVASAVAVVSLGVGSSALGSISGPCTASLAGVDVTSRGTGPTDKPITVGHDAAIPVVMRANGQLTHVHIDLEFAGISWTVKDKTVKTPVYTDTVAVND